MPVHEAIGPTFWGYFTTALQSFGAVAILAMGWLWSRINRGQDEMLRAHIRITNIEKLLLEHKAEVNKDFPTRQEVRRILEDITNPIRVSAERTESMVDELVRFHMQGNGEN